MYGKFLELSKQCQSKTITQETFQRDVEAVLSPVPELLAEFRTFQQQNHHV